MSAPEAALKAKVDPPPYPLESLPSLLPNQEQGFEGPLDRYGYYYFGGKYGSRGGKDAYALVYYYYTLGEELEKDPDLRETLSRVVGKEKVEAFISTAKSLESYLRAYSGKDKASFRIGEELEKVTRAFQKMAKALMEKGELSITVRDLATGQDVAFDKNNPIKVDGIVGIQTITALVKVKELLESWKEALQDLKSLGSQELERRLSQEDMAGYTPSLSTAPSGETSKEEEAYDYFAVKVERPSKDSLGDVETIFAPPLEVVPSSYARTHEELKKHREFAKELAELLKVEEEGPYFYDLVSLILSGKERWKPPSVGREAGEKAYFLHIFNREGRPVDPHAFLEEVVVKHTAGTINRYATLHRFFSEALRRGYTISITTPAGVRITFTPERWELVEGGKGGAA